MLNVLAAAAWQRLASRRDWGYIEGIAGATEWWARSEKEGVNEEQARTASAFRQPRSPPSHTCRAAGRVTQLTAGRVRGRVTDGSVGPQFPVRCRRAPISATCSATGVR